MVAPVSAARSPNIPIASSRLGNRSLVYHDPQQSEGQPVEDCVLSGRAKRRAAAPGPRECWMPVPIAAPVRSGPNSLRPSRERRKAELPQAFAGEAWGFESGTIRQISLRMPICLRSLGLGRFTLQAFFGDISVL
jgi:hypothetical protein